MREFDVVELPAEPTEMDATERHWVKRGLAP